MTREQIIFSIGELIGEIGFSNEKLVILIPEEQFYQIADSPILINEVIHGNIEKTTIYGIRCRPTKEKTVIVGLEKAFEDPEEKK